MTHRPSNADSGAGQPVRHVPDEPQAFLLQLSDELRPLADPVGAQAVATRMLGEWLGASRAYYVEYDATERVATVEREYRADPTAPTVAGRYRYEAYRAVLDRVGDGHTWTVADMATDSSISQGERDTFAALSVISWLNVPLVKGGVLRAVLCVVQDQARWWDEREVQVVVEVAERTWDAVERARAEAALREATGRLQLALEVGEIGTATYLVSEDRLLWDRRAAELFGIEQPETAMEAMTARVHPDDRPAFVEEQRTVLDSPSPTYHSEGQYRVIRPDGSVRWVHGRVAISWDDGDGGPEPRQALITVRDVTEQKRFEAAQRDFLAMTSHELRNPLASLRGNAQLMQRWQRYDEDLVEAVIAQTNHLERLVRDLLDVTMASTGRFSLHRAPIELVGLVRSEIQEQQVQTPIHRIELLGEVGRLEGEWDGDRLRQIMRNLLSNAIKYSPKGGPIEVRIERGTDDVAVSVRDHGVGIPPEEREHIFRPFYRLESHTGRVDGLGARPRCHACVSRRARGHDRCDLGRGP
ncbi:MAG: sensor histidine kinase [Dehalococcoidia bacterium]